MNEQTLTTLQPVILGNDDYEETSLKQMYSPECEETCVKHVYSPDDSQIQCGQRVTSLLNVNISSRNLINVTPENVSNLYEDITSSSNNMLSLSQSVKNLIQSYRQVPKDLFLSHLLSDYHSDEIELKHLRALVFSELKDLEEFPYSLGAELKRRKNSKMGESTAMKLCSDIYILTSIFDGAPFEDMKGLSSVSKVNTDHTQNDTVCIDSPAVLATGIDCCKHDSDLALFRSILTTVQADIFSLKQENTTLRDEYKHDLKSIRADVVLLKTDITEVIDKLQSAASECQQAVERITDERCNGVARVKSDIKLFRSDLCSLNETVDLNYRETNDKLSNIHKLEKRITKLENKLEKNKEITSPYNRAPNESFSCANDLTSCKSAFADYNTDNTATCDFQAEMIQSEDATSFEKSKRQDYPAPNGKLVQCPETKKFYRLNAVDNQQPQPVKISDKVLDRTLSNQMSGVQCNPEKQDDSMICTGKLFPNNYDDRDHSDYLPVSDIPLKNRYDALGTVNDTHTSTYSDVVKRPVQSTTSDSNNGFSTTIPVRISDRRKQNVTTNKQVPALNSRDVRPKHRFLQSFVNSADNEQNESDGDFIQHVRSKSLRCYVGGFKSSITENLLCNYVQCRGVFVSWLNIRRYPDQNRAVIQINVDGERGASLFEEGFWPEGVQCRPWYPRNAYRRKLQTQSYQAADRETYDNVYVVNDDTSIHSFVRNID